MKETKLKAREIVNSIYQPLGYLRCMVSNNEMWEWAKERAKEQISLLKSQIPMYAGGLNSKWDFWNAVEQEIDKL
ncbi:hypothetical protein D0T49_03570 [Paludibacter sp. 221]|uniref:hypothetical protein n=1 Tax=Paludibacter sp. 221 TaxID=2302939 RepID=UPI0013CFE618|nr:hypothetical protein [Paludibacter sp. 221]NDV46119.1 hypothetical protein [Paludibacter sp. 221]